MTLIQNVDAILDATAELRTLKEKLAALEEERVHLEDQIKVRIARIREAAGDGDERPASFDQLGPVSFSRQRSVGTTERVLATVNEFGGRAVTAPEIAAAWGTTDENTVNTIRAALSRLAASKQIQKVGYGRYAALTGSAATGGESAA